MKTKIKQTHSVSDIFSLLLFGIYVLFLILMIVFCADLYQKAVAGQDENQNLRTAQAYITSKFRQHDSPGGVSIQDFQGYQALTFMDEIDGETYCTYLYLQDSRLKELFTSKHSNASAAMGTVIADIELFSVAETQEGFYKIQMEDDQGNTGCLYLHPGHPKGGSHA